MCECGCGSFGIERAFSLPGGKVMAYGVYKGCRDCFSGPGISIYVFPNKKSEWLEGVEIEKFKIDEYGGEGGMGVSVSFFEVQDLISAAKEIGGLETGEESSYLSFDEWLEDNGLRMMQAAMKKFEKRTEELRKRKK